MQVRGPLNAGENVMAIEVHKLFYICYMVTQDA